MGCVVCYGRVFVCVTVCKFIYVYMCTMLLCLTPEVTSPLVSFHTTVSEMRRCWLMKTQGRCTRRMSRSGTGTPSAHWTLIPVSEHTVSNNDRWLLASCGLVVLRSRRCMGSTHARCYCRQRDRIWGQARATSNRHIQVRYTIDTPLAHR